MFVMEMSDFFIPIGYTQSGRLGSITTVELAKSLAPYMGQSILLPSEGNIEAGKNIQLMPDIGTGTTIISTVEDPTFSSVDVNTPGSPSYASLVSEPPSLVMAKAGVPMTTLAQQNSGFFTQTIGADTYIVLTTGNVSGDGTIIVTPTANGATVSITPNPVFTTVGVGSAVLSYANGALQVNNGTGASPILSAGGISGGSNITVTPTASGVSIATVQNPTFTTSITTPLVNVTNGAAVGAITSSATGQLQQTFGGQTFLIPTPAQVGTVTSVTGVGNIVTTTTGGAVTVNTVTNPTFVGLTIGATVLSANGSGRLQETIGGTSLVLLAQGDIVGASPIIVTTVGTTNTIGVAANPTFQGGVTIASVGTTPGSLAINNTSSVATISLSGQTGTVTTSVLNATGGVTTPLVNVTNGAAVGQLTSDPTTGQLRQTFGGQTFLIPTTTGGNGVTSITAGTNIAVSANTGAVTISTVPNPNFTTSVTTPSLVLGANTLTSSGTGAVTLNGIGTLLTTANTAAGSNIVFTANGAGYIISTSTTPTFAGLTVTGNSTFGGTLSGTNLSLIGSLTVGGQSTFNNVTTTGNTNINTLNTTGNATVGGTLVVSGTTTLNNLVLNGTLAGLNSLTVGTLIATTSVTAPTVTGTSSVVVGTTAITQNGNNLQIANGAGTTTLLTAANVTAGSNITVTGSGTGVVIATVQNPTFAISVTTPSLVLGANTLGSNGNGIIQVSSGAGTTVILTAANTIAGSNIVITTTGTGATIATSLTPTFTTLTATGATNLNGGLNTTNIAASGTLAVTGLSSLNGGLNTTTLTTTGNATIGGNLSVNGTTTFGTINVTNLGVSNQLTLGINALTAVGTRVLINGSNVTTTASQLPGVAGLGNNPYTDTFYLITITYTPGGANNGFAVSSVAGTIPNTGLYTAATGLTATYSSTGTLSNVYGRLSIKFNLPTSAVGRSVIVTPYTNSINSYYSPFAVWNYTDGQIDLYNFTGPSTTLASFPLIAISSATAFAYTLQFQVRISAV